MKGSPLKWLLLLMAYGLLALFAPLLCMGSETLIGSAHPLAELVADAIMWAGLLAALSTVACLLAALLLGRKPRLRRVVLMLPFGLLTVQCILIAAAGWM